MGITSTHWRLATREQDCLIFFWYNQHWISTICIVDRVSPSPPSLCRMAIDALKSGHCNTGGPKVSMVSMTRDRWSRNDPTDTRNIRASSAPHLTDNVRPDTESCLQMPPFLGSRSGERELRAIEASRADGKGTSRALRTSVKEASCLSADRSERFTHCYQCGSGIH